jgi:DNA-binding beta-propeller fold protein YncE
MSLLKAAQNDLLHAIGTTGRMIFGFGKDGRVIRMRTNVFSQSQDWEPTSIAIDPAGRGFAAVSWVPDPVDQMPGVVQIIDLDTGDPVWQFNIGYHPDCIMFSPDGTFLYAANEGEPSTSDRVGAISVAELSGIERIEDFFGFNEVRTYPIIGEHVADGVELGQLRVAPEHQANPGVNIEPEYIAAMDGGAWVSVQENNGLMFFDVDQRKWTRALSLPGLSFALDVSERDGAQLYSGVGMMLLPMPDTIDTLQWNGQTFLVTANEGEKTPGHEAELRHAIRDGRIDAERVEALETQFGDLESHGVADLKISLLDGDVDGDGDIDVLSVQGGRSVSIIDAETGTVVWNSGPQIELITGMLFTEQYNAGDSRSDRAGPEPEGLALIEHGGRTLLAVGLERTGAVLLYDVSNPFAPMLLDAIALSTECAGPEGMCFVVRNERVYLAVGAEVGGCLSLFELNVAD